MARRVGTAIPSTPANTAVEMRTSSRLAPRCPAGIRRTGTLATPVPGAGATAAAGQAGLAASDIPCLLVEGDNRAGWGAEMARALADAGINIAFLMAQVIGRRFAVAIGFEDDAAAAEAMKMIRKSGAPARARRPPPGRGGGKRRRR